MLRFCAPSDLLSTRIPPRAPPQNLLDVSSAGLGKTTTVSCEPSLELRAQHATIGGTQPGNIQTASSALRRSRSDDSTMTHPSQVGKWR